MVAKKKNRSLDALVDVIDSTRVVNDGSRGGVGFRDGVVVPEPRSGGVGSVSTDGVRQFDLLTSPSYAGVLQKFGLDGSKFMQLLAELGISTGRPMSDVQQDDWNKQLLDSMLAAASEQDARDFNIAMRDEQRIWDSPTNQLARLMGAGISRDAAIQILSGGGSGSGAGSITGAAAPMATGIPASQSTLNDIQGKTAIANTVFGGFQALTGLVNLGFSVPQAIQQVQFLSNQNLLSRRQIDAYDAAGDAFQIMNAAGSAAECFGSVGAASAELVRLAENGNSDALEYIASGRLNKMKQNASFSSQTLGSLYKSERESQDYAEMYDLYARQARAQSLLTEISYDQVAQEILNDKAELEKILADTDFIRENKNLLLKQASVLEEQAKVLRKQGFNVDADTALKKAEKLRIDAETESFNLSNNQERAFQLATFGEGNNVHTGLEWLTAKRIQELYGDVQTLSSLRRSDYFSAKATEMLSTTESITAYNLLTFRRSNSSLEFSTENPAESKFGWALEDCGLNAYLESGQKSHVDFKGVPLETNEHADFQDMLKKERDKYHKPWWLKNHK